MRENFRAYVGKSKDQKTRSGESHKDNPPYMRGYSIRGLLRYPLYRLGHSTKRRWDREKSLYAVSWSSITKTTSRSYRFVQGEVDGTEQDSICTAICRSRSAWRCSFGPVCAMGRRVIAKERAWRILLAVRSMFMRLVQPYMQFLTWPCSLLFTFVVMVFLFA